MIYVHRARERHYGDKGKPWVARLGGVSPRFGFRREFVRPRRDYRNASKRLSGKYADIEACFLLDAGWVCEFYVPGFGRKDPDRRYFARVTESGLARMSEVEVIEWLTRIK